MLNTLFVSPFLSKLNHSSFMFITVIIYHLSLMYYHTAYDLLLHDVGHGQE